MRMLVTGGAGFIGSNFIRNILSRQTNCHVVNLDKLTYAGNPDNLKDIEKDNRYSFIHGDICDKAIIDRVLHKDHFDIIVHFAAESHVDRSITEPSVFIQTNVLGTYNLLESAREYQVSQFIHVSTDEVYGSRLSGSFNESDRLSPSSPYSASKAGADLLALSYYATYEFPVIVTRCTNNFGPFQFPEKLIPLFSTNLLNEKKVPVYGTGKNVRDWIYVLDHCRAIEFLITHGKVGEIYNIGSGNEHSNLEITRMLLELLGKDSSSIEFVKDRPGHDFRYSLDISKIRSLGWKPDYSFQNALRETVDWYKNNRWWWEPLQR